MVSARNLFAITALFAMCSLSACSGASTIPPMGASPTPITPAATATQPTPTLEPSHTPEPTALPSPTMVPTATQVPPLAMLENGLSGWCVSMGDPNATNIGPEVKPTNAVDIVTENGQIDVIGEFSRCYFFISFNQPMPNGAQVRFYDGSYDFYQSPLEPMLADANTSWALINHTYITNPPAWELFFRLDIVAVDGTTLYSTPYHIARGWTPTECWNGQLPNPQTLKCPLRQDLHPWDAGYGVY